MFILCVVWLLLYRTEDVGVSEKKERILPASRKPFVVAQLIYRGGDWDSNSGALEVLCRYYKEHVDPSVAFDLRFGVPGRGLAGVSFLYATGHFGFDLEPADLAGLVEWAAAGGIGMIEDNNGMDAAFRRFVEEQGFGLSADVDRGIFQKPFAMPGGRMPKIMKHAGKPSALLSIVIRGKPTRLYYSFSADLGDGWEHGGKHNLSEELRERSLQMGANLLHQAIAVRRS